MVGLYGTWLLLRGESWSGEGAVREVFRGEQEVVRTPTGGEDQIGSKTATWLYSAFRAESRPGFSLQRLYT